MTRMEQDRLFEEILAGDDYRDFRKSSLENGLRFLHRRKRQRRIMRFSAAVLVTTFLGFALWFTNSSHSSQSPLVSISTPAPLDTGRVKFISDKELLGLFPNRPLALIGRPGQQELVFLDTTASQNSSASQSY